MAQGHPVLPPYGSGLGRERAVFPRYYRSRPSLLAKKAATACQVQESAGRLRQLWPQLFVGSQASVLIVRINCGGRLEDRGHDRGGPVG